MKNLKSIFIMGFLPLLFFFFLPETEGSAQVKKMSANDLTDASTAVLYGKCTKLKSEWNQDKSIIYTYVTIAPEEYIKGNLGAQAVIAVPGGQVGNIIYEVSEMPVFIEGEEVVAFVRTNPAGKNLVTGGYQGKMKIEKDKKTGKKIVKTEGSDSEAEGEALDSFVTKVKGYMKHK